MKKYVILVAFFLFSFDLYSDQDLDLQARQYQARQAILANMNQQRFRIQPRFVRRPANQSISKFQNPANSNNQQMISRKQPEVFNNQSNQPQQVQNPNQQMPIGYNGQGQAQHCNQQGQNAYCQGNMVNNPNNYMHQNQGGNNQQQFNNQVNHCPTCKQNLPVNTINNQNGLNFNNFNQGLGLNNVKKLSSRRRIPFTTKKHRRFR